MIYYVLADPHFGHAKMVTDGHRPEGFEEIILENLSALKTKTSYFYWEMSHSTIM